MKSWIIHLSEWYQNYIRTVPLRNVRNVTYHSIGFSYSCVILISVWEWWGIEIDIAERIANH